MSATAASVVAGPRVRAGLSIQSILLIMLLTVSLLSSAVVGAIGFINGRESLRDAAFSSLTEVRDSRAREVTALFATIENTLLVEARSASVTAAFAPVIEPAEMQPGEAEPDSSLADYISYMTEQLGYSEALLIDGDGTIVYPADGGNLLDGPQQFTQLATAFTSVMTKNQPDDVVFTDFEPAEASPTAWAVAPVSLDGQLAGALAVALPSSTVDAVMTTGRDWSNTALGKTGETYLVGPDLTMRSTSRLLIDDPDAYRTAARASGLSDEEVDAAVASGATLLLQPVTTDAVTAAFAIQTGVIIDNGYLGGETLTSFAPLGIEELDWVIVAQMQTSEAFAPVDEFTKKLAISSALMLFVVAVLSIVLAQIIVRPLKRLKLAARRIAAGEVGTQVDAGRSDELAELGAAFNDMSTSLQLKASLLDEQQKENDRLLALLMPESVAKRYREGVQTISEEHQEVSVIYADIVGFERFSSGLSSEKALELLNDLYRRFDEAAEENGIERVRTTRQGYLASCGLTVPRVDHARRMVDFAIDMQQILTRFGGQHGAELNIRAGIDSGTVTSGLVGKAHVSYDLWGEAVNLAFNLQRGTNEPGLFLTDRVVERLASSKALIDLGMVDTGGETQHLWRIDLEAELA